MPRVVSARRVEKSVGVGVLPRPPGNRESPVKMWVWSLSSVRRAGRMAAEVDDRECECADGDGVCVGELVGGGYGYVGCVEWVGGGGAVVVGGDIGKCPPVVDVVVGGDDEVELSAGFLVDEFDDADGVVGGVDEQGVAGGGALDQIGVVVGAADRHFDDSPAGDVAFLRVGGAGDVSRRGVGVQFDRAIGHGRQCLPIR